MTRMALLAERGATVGTTWRRHSCLPGRTLLSSLGAGIHARARDFHARLCTVGEPKLRLPHRHALENSPSALSSVRGAGALACRASGDPPLVSMPGCALPAAHGYSGARSVVPALARGLTVVLGLSLFACTSTPQKEKAAGPEGAYRIYVTNEASGEMSVIDSARHEVIATVKLGKRPRGIHASPDGRTIYVALSGSPMAPPGVDESTLPPPDRSADGIGVFDVESNKLVRVIASGSDPEEFDLSPDGKLIYVSNEDVAKASIIDIAAGKVIHELEVGEEPEGVTTSPDGKFVYVTSEDDGAIFVIDTAAAKVIKNFKVGLRPRDVAFLPNGTKAYATRENDGKVSVIDAAKHAVTGEIVLGGEEIKPMAVTLSPDATRAYVSTGRAKKVFVIDTATDKVLSSFEVGLRPWGIGVSPDGKLLYTANGPANDVSVVDLATEAVIQRVQVADRPWGILVLPRRQ